MTQENVLREARELASQGWTLLACDEPEKATLGFVAFRYVDKTTREPVPRGEPWPPGREIDEETRNLQWPLFDRPLVPDDATVGAPELAAFLSEGEVLLCDNPKNRLVGFVRYEPEQGRAVVRRMRLTDLKGADVETKDRITGLRDRLLGAQKAAYEQRTKEVAAIHGAAEATPGL